MKLMLILCSDETYHAIASCVKPLGFDIVHYRHPTKAMDNLDEIDPQGVIISAVDFPRHWKTIVQFIRAERPRSLCPVIILHEENFTRKESGKALHLGVSGLILETLEESELSRLQGILERCIPLKARRRGSRLYPGESTRSGFVFARPGDKALVTGKVKSLSGDGLSFLPDAPSLTAGLPLNAALPECSLRAGDAILSPLCRLACGGSALSIEFLAFPEDGEKEIFAAYLLQSCEKSEKCLL